MAERSIARSASAINWMLEYQPFVTTGAGDFPIGYLPIGALPIGIFPIGALPMTGCGGGGWGCGRSAATAALSIPSDVAVAMRNFIPPPPSLTTDSNRLSKIPEHVVKLLPENRVNKSAAAKREPASITIPAGVAAEPLVGKFGCSGLDIWQRGPYRSLPPVRSQWAHYGI
jgi:hypothetical protein